MNRAVWTITDPPPADLLPPERRSGRARLLFVQGAELGFASTARHLATVTAARDEVDAVHVSLPIRGLFRVLGARWPVPLGGLDAQPYRSMLAWSWVIGRLLRTALPADRFDVIHFMTQQRGLAAAGLRGRTRARLVINADAIAPSYDAALGNRRGVIAPEVGGERRALLAADLVACSSRWCADSCVRDFGVDPGRIVLHKPCAMVGPSQPRRDHADASTRGAPGGPPVRLVFVGNDWARKGGPRILEWHQRHWAGRAQLHVCSASAPRDDLLRNVVWHGPTPHDRLMREVLPSMDAFVMPTLADTFLIAAQEAQAAGLPVVTSRMAGIPEVVRDGETGFLCPARDDAAFVAAIGRLIDDGALRAQMGAAARDHAMRNLSGEVWHNHLIDALVALADGRPARYAPEGVDVRRSDAEAASPRTQPESLASPPAHEPAGAA